jgi:small GTP-binding protein
MSDIKTESKILIMGLANSGKTSILLSIQRRTNLLSYIGLKPTRGVNITEITEAGSNSAYNIWDLGGQEQYIQNHLDNLDKYLEYAEKLIFVIDIQDQEKYSLAVEYFEKIMDGIKKKEIKPKVSIYFHKHDPNLDDIKSTFNKDLVTELNDNIIKKIPEGIDFLVFKTSIYTIFNKILYT